MRNWMRTSLLILLAGGLVPPAAAERPRDKLPGEEFAAIADQWFNQFFSETDAERKNLQEIRISKQQERQIGEAGLQAMLDALRQRRIPVHMRGKDATYLTSLAAEIHPLMKNAKRYPAIRVHVAETSEIDARAFPGGSIVCSTGMIGVAGSEAALIGVLAHELSHIDRGHQLRMARSIKLAESTWTTGNTPPEGWMRNMVQLSRQFARPFRPEDEAEADRDAAQWMFELGYDPMEMAALFRRLDKRQMKDAVRLPNFLRTHPYNADRYDAVRNLAERLQAAEPAATLYVGKMNLESRTMRREKQFAE
jgi:predicted Zn-dependent protease